MRTLLADEIECRVAQVTSKGCSLLLYKTARVDRAILDETFGQFGWQNDFKVIDGKMYGGIGVYSNDLCEWLWRWDCGTESNTEQEKGQASDCFKRAGFKWGIGVELYSAPFIFVKVPTEQVNGKWVLCDKYKKFEVTEIGYSDKREINKLTIIDSNGEMVYKLGQKIKAETPKPLSDNDRDIIAGLDGMDCKENAHNYFKTYESEVENIEAFKDAYTKAYKSLPKRETLQNGGA